MGFNFEITGVAKAFNEKIHAHPDLVKVCKEYFGTDDLSSPKLKMAHVSVHLCE